MTEIEHAPAIVLLSGGLDSATTAAIAADEGFVIHALSFDYGQRHRKELEAATRVAAALGVVDHRVVRFDLRVFGGSALTDEIEVPKDRSPEAMAEEIPLTYVPARNTIFLAFALAAAEVIGARDLFLGVNAVDYAGYPDCRPGFIEAFERLANLATRIGIEGLQAGHPIRIHAPLINLTKAQIIRRGLELGLDYGPTWSCYDPTADGRPCGHCDSCLLRVAGFREAGVADPGLA